ncbi:MAG: aminotransferase class V-fold PLP-dependent enzyme, partial [Desulfobacteraceae bacterium]|nr:aminotransferase class V-fold PLP-dependent enzyme [Desulfobacteraceae bacterium]
LSKPNDLIGRIPPFFPGGGYPLQIELFNRKQLPLIFSKEKWQIDIEKTFALLKKHQPPLVILASSIVTYPVPINEIAKVVHAYGGIVAFDGSHTLGLIAGGQFQDPLNEGADLLFGSTHKTFPGPQGGIILTNKKDIHEKLEKYINLKPLDGPTMICNPHLARIAATGIVLEETQWTEYAYQVVKNSQAIANTLLEKGVPLYGVENSDYEELTYSHQVVPDYSMEKGIKLRDYLAENRLLTDGFVRIGTSEITRLGFKEEECRKIGDILAWFLKNEKPENPEMLFEIEQLIDSHPTVVL